MQVALSSIDTSCPLALAMYTVWLAGSAKGAMGCDPGVRGTATGVTPQPEGCSPLHVAPLNTDTVPSPKLVTYTVSVFSSIAMPLGRFPTVIVGHGPLQRETSCASHRRVSITETVFPPALGPLLLNPLAT